MNDNVFKNIQKYARELRHEKVEHAILLDKEGNLITRHTDNNGEWVDWTTIFNKLNIDKFTNGMIMIHNHPRRNDLYFMYSPRELTMPSEGDIAFYKKWTDKTVTRVIVSSDNVMTINEEIYDID